MNVLTMPLRLTTCGRTLRLEILFLLLLAATNSRGQITNVTNDQATPTPGVGHDYIGTLNDIVNPSNGSLSIRIAVPTPPGRGLNLPVQFSYNSNGIAQVASGGNYVSVNSNQDSRFLEQGGWGYGLPQLSTQQIQVPGNDPTYPSATCPIYTGFVFADNAGSRHAMGLAMPDYSICNTTGVHSGYSMAVSYSSYDGSYLTWTANDPTDTGTNDVQGQPFSVSDNDGTYYHFPFLAPLCVSAYCNVPDYMEDRNGNEINFIWGSSTNPFPLTITDTAGRDEISIPSFDSATGDQITVSGFSAPYVVKWESVPYNMTISITAAANNANATTVSQGCNDSYSPYNSTSGSMQVVKSIELPNGKSYQFQYDSTYGLLNKIIYPTGAYVQYAWGPSQQPSDAVSYEVTYTVNPPFADPPQLLCWALYNAPSILHRYVSYDGETVAQQQDFVYSTTFPGGGGLWTAKQTTVTTTDFARTGSPNFQTVYTYSPTTIPPPPDILPSIAGQVPLEHIIQYDDFNGKLLQTVTKSWAGYPGNPVLSEQDTTLPNGQTSRTVLMRDSAENIIEKDENDYGQSTQTRTTITNYQSLLVSRPAYSFPPPILDLPCQIIVYAGSSTGTRMAETDLEYDGGTTVCGTPGTPSLTPVSGLPTGTHDETNFGTSSTFSRGNVTTSVNWSSTGTSPTTTYTYDETGQVLTKKDPCGNTTCSDMAGTSSHITTYSYADSPSGGNAAGNSNAYLTLITDPLGHQRSVSTSLRQVV